jgi:hypothetical protein
MSDNPATGLTIVPGVSIDRMWTTGVIALQHTSVAVGSNHLPLQPLGNLRQAGQATWNKLGWIYRKLENTTTTTTTK